jgi:hypothetical protein
MWQAWPEVLSLATITSLQRAWVIQNRTRNAAQNNELTFLFAPFPVNSREALAMYEKAYQQFQHTIAMDPHFSPRPSVLFVASGDHGKIGGINRGEPEERVAGWFQSRGRGCGGGHGAASLQDRRRKRGFIKRI